MRSFTLLVVLAFSLASCTESKPQSAQVDIEAEKEAVQQTVADWLNEGIASLDTTNAGSYLTPSFGLMEPRWMSKSEFLEWMTTFDEEFGGPGNIEYSFSDWHTTIKGDIAWTSVVNDAVLTRPGEDPVHWKFTETGVLLKQTDGRWLIDRYHSTSIPASE